MLHESKSSLQVSTQTLSVSLFTAKVRVAICLRPCSYLILFVDINDKKAILGTVFEAIFVECVLVNPSKNTSLTSAGPLLPSLWDLTAKHGRQQPPGNWV